MSLFDPLHRLRHLDRSSSEFPNHLTNLLHEQGYGDWVTNLQDDDSTWLVEYLDNALNTLRPTSSAFRECLRELRAICGSRKILPQSSILPGSPPDTAKWPIGSRGSCDVYEGSLDDSKVCVKRLRMYSNDGEGKAKHAFCQEVVVWKRLEHANIVPLMGITVAPFQLISVWMAGGELSEYIGVHPRADRLSLVSDVADGLSYLHSHGVIHGDLKGPSILVDETGHARLTDFGLAAVTPEVGSAGSIKDGHAVRWAAPEVLDKGRSVSKESDVYSFAMVVIEAFTGIAPFYGIPPTTVAVGILSGDRPTRPTHLSLTNDLWGMTERCWNQDPQHRPDISEVVYCLQTTLVLRRDHVDVIGNQVPDDTTSGGVRQRELSPVPRFRPSHWTPVSYVVRGLSWLGKLFPVPRSSSDAEQTQDTGSGVYEKPITERRQIWGAPNPARRDRGWFSRYRVMRRPRAARQRSK